MTHKKVEGGRGRTLKPNAGVLQQDPARVDHAPV